MTMMVHILLRLRGDEDWNAWEDNMERYDRADRISEGFTPEVVTPEEWQRLHLGHLASATQARLACGPEPIPPVQLCATFSRTRHLERPSSATPKENRPCFIEAGGEVFRFAPR